MKGARPAYSGSRCFARKYPAQGSLRVASSLGTDRTVHRSGRSAGVTSSHDTGMDTDAVDLARTE
jgi:hypothetical protein